jgi:hypothetical protein
MSSVVISGDTSGAITLAAPAVSGTNTATLPAATGTVMVSGNMPAFNVYQGTSQSVTSGVYTKIAFTIKSSSGNATAFDTNGYFDNATNYRFTPLIAGYYQINLVAYGSATAMTYIQTAIYKNGTNFANTLSSSQSSTNGAAMISAVIYFNGSTDYVEGYASISGTSPTLGATGATNLVQMSGSLVRSA